MRRDKMNDFVSRLEAASLKTMRQLSSELSDDYSELHLTPAQFFVLRQLSERRQATVTELADALRVKPSAVTAIVDRLVRNGWATRERTESDRRVVHIRATEAGLRVLQQAETTRQRIMEKYLSLLEEEELEHLVKIYEKLATIIDNANERR